MTAGESTHDWTVLAHLLRPQGRKGEILAELLTDFPERFENSSDVYLARPGYSGPPDPLRTISVSSHWLPVGRNHGRIVLTLAGVDSITAAELLAGLDIVVPTEARVELDDDAEYISDLIDCEVYDHGIPVGKVTGVDFAMSPDGSRRLVDAAPLLTLETADGEEVLIPYVQQFLVRLAVEERRIEMQLPEGLIGLNRPGKQQAEPPAEEE